MDIPQIRVETVGDVVVAHLGGTAGEPLPADVGLRGLIERGTRKLVVDTGTTAIVGSSFLGHLLMVQHRSRLAGCQLRVCCPTSGLRDVFQITKLDQLLPVYKSLDEALAGF